MLACSRGMNGERRRRAAAGAAAGTGVHCAQLRRCPPLAPGDGHSRSGPGLTTNWLIPGRLLCGAMPEPVEEDHQQLSAVTHFVGLTAEGAPLRFRAQSEVKSRALCAAQGVDASPPSATFIRHTINELATGSADVVLAAVASIMEALAGDPAAVVYLHCRAGHGRTGMVAAILIGSALTPL